MRAPTAARVREVLDYDPSTGIFTWKQRTSNRVRVGTIIGHLRHDGYHCISIDGVVYLAHLLAWLYVYGKWPQTIVDHEDTIRNHNWIGNLRPATGAQNLINSGAPRRNTSGFKGVSFQQVVGRWQAYIGVARRQVHLGYFDTAEAAALSRKAAEKKYYGIYAPHPAARSVPRENGPSLVDLGRAARAAGLTITDIEAIGRDRARGRELAA